MQADPDTHVKLKKKHGGKIDGTFEQINLLLLSFTHYSHDGFMSRFAPLLLFFYGFCPCIVFFLDSTLVQ
jgi:hypothetical protein